MGDVLRTKSGILHLVIACRQVRSRVHPRRFALTLEHCSEERAEDQEHLGHRILPFYWYPRGRRK